MWRSDYVMHYKNSQKTLEALAAEIWIGRELNSSTPILWLTLIFSHWSLIIEPYSYITIHILRLVQFSYFLHKAYSLYTYS